MDFWSSQKGCRVSIYIVTCTTVKILPGARHRWKDITIQRTNNKPFLNIKESIQSLVFLCISTREYYIRVHFSYNISYSLKLRGIFKGNLIHWNWRDRQHEVAIYLKNYLGLFPNHLVNFTNWLQNWSILLRIRTPWSFGLTCHTCNRWDGTNWTTSVPNSVHC